VKLNTKLKLTLSRQMCISLYIYIYIYILGWGHPNLDSHLVKGLGLTRFTRRDRRRLCRTDAELNTRLIRHDVQCQNENPSLFVFVLTQCAFLLVSLM